MTLRRADESAISPGWRGGAHTAFENSRAEKRAFGAIPSPPGPPMTPGNMRALGVRSLAGACDERRRRTEPVYTHPNRLEFH